MLILALNVIKQTSLIFHKIKLAPHKHSSNAALCSLSIMHVHIYSLFLLRRRLKPTPEKNCFRAKLIFRAPASCNRISTTAAAGDRVRQNIDWAASTIGIWTASSWWHWYRTCTTFEWYTLYVEHTHNTFLPHVNLWSFWLQIHWCMVNPDSKGHFPAQFLTF